jgi:hypothetical protein
MKRLWFVLGVITGVVVGVGVWEWLRQEKRVERHMVGDVEMTRTKDGYWMAFRSHDVANSVGFYDNKHSVKCEQDKFGRFVINDRMTGAQTKIRIVDNEVYDKSLADTQPIKVET